MSENKVEIVDVSHTEGEGWARYARADKGDGSCRRAMLHPETLDIDIGNLQVRMRQPAKSGRYVAACMAEILVNGKPLACRRLVLTLDVDDVVKVECEFFGEIPEKP